MTEAAYPIDPELAPRLEVVTRFDFADHEAARAAMARGPAFAPAYEPPVPLTVQEVLVPAAGDAPPVPVRVYRPEGRSVAPGLLHLHGGGFALGSVAAADADARRLAAEAGMSSPERGGEAETTGRPCGRQSSVEMQGARQDRRLAGSALFGEVAARRSGWSP
ncbi:hypothetical protein [Streptomyces sp. NPDC001833]|uniref:hypothetical protein n=1 Tax=Streptomyces sp. NPDC001833 TaxID=3154658 RepID=UPI00332327E3